MVAGTLGVTLGSTLTGAVTLGSSLTGGSTSDILINVDKFSVLAATGNTVIGGTLVNKGAVTLETTLGVTGATTLTGAVTLESTLTGGATSDVDLNAKFTVDAGSGNTVVFGTLTGKAATVVEGGGIAVTGGLTVNNAGLVVTTGGASVSGGLLVANGLTVSTFGLQVELGGAVVKAGKSELHKATQKGLFLYAAVLLAYCVIWSAALDSLMFFNHAL